MNWACLLAVPVCAVLCLALVPVARRRGWMDRPEGRKNHDRPTPLVGGPAILATVGALLLTVGPLPTGLLPAALLVFAAGFADDRRALGALPRFLAQIAACLVMVYWGGLLLSDFGRLMWDGVLELGPLAVAITVFSALGVINAFNMIDGLDGLCGTLFIIAAVALGGLAAAAGNTQSAALACICAASVGGFLALNARWPWNPAARVFLGDSGSALLGFLLAWLAIDLGSGAHRAIAPMTAVWIVGLPLLDTTRLIAGRWRRGQSAFAADRYHLHHAFLRAGFSVRESWLAMCALAAVMVAVGAGMELVGVPDYFSFWSFILFGLAYFSVLHRAWRKRRFLGRPMVL